MSKSGPRTKGLTFDLGGTLADYPDFKQLICSEVVREFLNLDVQDMEGLLELFGDWRDVSLITQKEFVITEVIDAFLKSKGAEITPGEMVELLELMYDDYFQKVKLYQETLLVLDECRRRNYKLALITNTCTPIRQVKKELKDLGIYGFFDAIMVSSHFGYRKPHGSIFWWALMEIGLSINEAIHIGDLYERDIIGAKNIRLFSLWINRLGKRAPGPCEQISELTEVFSYCR